MLASTDTHVGRATSRSTGKGNDPEFAAAAAVHGARIEVSSRPGPKVNRHSTVFSALMACTHAGWATPVVDQTSGLSDPSGRFTGISAFYGSITEAQTFTVGVTGLLVQLIVSGYNSGELMVDIRGQSGGHPDNANVLQTVGVGDFDGLTAIDFSLAVTAGDPLSFVFHGGHGVLYGFNHDTYASGGLWTDGDPPYGEDGPGTWYPNGNQGMPQDLSFATLVDDGTVPESTSTALFGVGLAALLVSHRRAGVGSPSHRSSIGRP